MFDDIDLSRIQDDNARELIEQLLNQVEKLAADLRDAQAEIRRLRDEINRLKGEQGKPKILELFENVGIQLSDGELSNPLIKDQESFQAEEDAVYQAGLDQRIAKSRAKKANFELRMGYARGTLSQPWRRPPRNWTSVFITSFMIVFSAQTRFLLWRISSKKLLNDSIWGGPGPLVDLTPNY